MSRIYDKKINIDTNKIKEDYETMFETEEYKRHWDSSLLEQREKIEGGLIFSLIEKYKIDISNICDIACGDGFPAILFKDKKLVSYIGYDFSKSAIKVCNEKFKDYPFYAFNEKDISELKEEDLKSSKFIVCIGLLNLINDDVLEHILSIFGKREAYIYLRQSTAIIDERLTLDNFYSEEIKTIHNSIYRTDAEYKEVFRKHGLRLIETDIIKGIKQREETALKYYLLKTAK